MKIIYACCCLLFLIATSEISSAQTQSASLLWRITGNGLPKPSYLYGTMHLKDRRLFFFSDSLYRAIETTEGFAMEIDPDEMMDSIFTQLSNDTTALLRDIIGKDQYAKVSKKLEKKMGIPASKITRKKLIELRNSWYYKFKKEDDMKTAVDLYLFDIARRLGKWVGGIEDVADQINIKDEIGKNIDITEYLEDFDDSRKKAYLDKMIEVYVKEDITQLGRNISDNSERDFALITRNKKMARRMDSLSHIRATFFAVGAAHLPGDSGVINYLQQKGFVVEPVISSKKIAPEKYIVDNKEIPWIKFTGKDSAYIVEMPGKPSELKVMGDDLKFNVYADLVSNSAYMAGFVFVPDDVDIMKKKEQMISSFEKRGFKKIEEKSIQNNGISGIEMISLTEAIYYRLQVLVASRKMYMLMYLSEKKEALYSKDAEKFFNSFGANEKLEVKNKEWINFAGAGKGFSISFPTKPMSNKSVNEAEEKSMTAVSYFSLDIQNNSYYVVVVDETTKGYLIEDDSLIYNWKIRYYTDLGFTISEFKKTEFDGYPAVSFNAAGIKDGVDMVCKVLIVFRGNRTYTVVAITEKGREDFPDVTKFFRSFKIEPYSLSNWSDYYSPDSSYHTFAPAAIERIPFDTTALSGYELNEKLKEAKWKIECVTFDSVAALNYNITEKPFSRYYWKSDDSSFFADQLKTYYSDTASSVAKKQPGSFDSLIYRKAVTNGNATGVEILVKNASKSFYKKIRVLRNGNASYHMYVLAPLTQLGNEYNNRFFNDFRFVNDDLPTHLFANKTSDILAGLLMADSAAKAEAIDALSEVNFTAGDLPLLQKALLINYPADSNLYYTITGRIAQKIMMVEDSNSTLQFIKHNYPVVSSDSIIKMAMLEILAYQKSEQAVLLLKELMLKNPPVGMPVYNLAYNLTDSLLLARKLFPEAAVVFQDTLLGPALISVAVALIDSNLMDKSILLQQKKLVNDLAKWQLKTMHREQEQYTPYCQEVIGALEKIADKESIALLYEYLKNKDLYIKQMAALSLIKNEKLVPPVAFKLLAANPEYRTGFYESLKKLNKQSLFPKEYQSQRQFAESYLYSYAIEDADGEDTGVKLKLITEKTAKDKSGVLSKYYIFKITFSYDGEVNSYPAICGPFDINLSRPCLKEDIYGTKIYYDEKADPATINRIFKQFLEDQKEGN